MKPTCPCDWPRRLPRTDYFFHSGIGEWRGYSAPSDGDDSSEVRKFRNLSREFLIVSARERAKETAVFALVVVAAAWPVIYTVIVVVRLLAAEHPLAE